MKYSVLMSVYKNDDPSFLSLALESIYDQQTRKPDEIVVVFDGPLTEQLYEVLDRYSKERSEIVRYYPQATNQGLGEALRIGSLHCTGDYIFRMDSDDISHPLRFEKQIHYLENHPEIDVLGTDIAEFYECPDEPNLRVRACPKTNDAVIKMGQKRNPMNHVTVCMKKEALIKCGGYESLLLLEDYYLWLKMIVSGCQLANINESLVYVRIGNGFHSKRGSRTRITGWKVLQKYMIQHGLINRFMALRNMFYIRAFTYCPGWVKKIVYNKCRGSGLPDEAGCGVGCGVYPNGPERRAVMEKAQWFSDLVELLEGMGFAAREEEGRILWAMAYGEGPEETMAMGEMFLSSSLGLELPEDIDYLQTSVVFMTDIPAERLNELREFCARISRRIAGGYFGAHRGGNDTCFLEYAYDIALTLDAPDFRNHRLVKVSLDLAAAYLALSREAFAAVADGSMDAEQALEFLREDEE